MIDFSRSFCGSGYDMLAYNELVGVRDGAIVMLLVIGSVLCHCKSSRKDLRRIGWYQRWSSGVKTWSTGVERSYWRCRTN